MYDSRRRGHVELNVLQARGLRGRPVHTHRSGAGRDVGRVDDKVSHLAVEDIDRHPVQVRSPVGVAVDQAKAREAGRGLEHRP